ncbi:MAG: lysylphosphatidylglycerol synthase transmembrane domain-containing protein [Methanosarcina sp.]
MAMNKYKKWFVTALFISAVSIILVTSLTFNSDTLEALKKIKFEYFVAAAFSHILLYFIWGFRVQALCKALGHSVSSMKMTEMVISSTFVGGITPAFAGGELLKMHLLNKHGIPLGRATAVVVGERLLDALIIFSCLPLALYILEDTLSNYKLDLAFLIANFLLFISLFLFIYAVWKPEKVKNGLHKVLENRIIKKLISFAGKGANNRANISLTDLTKHIDREIDYFHGSIKLFFSEGKKGLLLGFIFTLLFWVVDFSLLVLILRGLSQNPSILTAFAAQVILAVIIIIPATPGASGVAELGAASIFSIFVSSSLLGITVIAWRTLTYHLNLLLGGLMSLKIFRDMDLLKKLAGNSIDSKEAQKEPENIF